MLLLVACASGWGCASEQIPNYGDPAQVAGGVGGAGGDTSSGGSGGTTTTQCMPDAGCAVKFSTDIFPLLDGTASCADTMLCHGDPSGKSDLALTAGDVDGYYDTLTAYTIVDVGKYIVPCDPGGSKMLCNLKVSGSGVMNPNGECGAAMPLVKADAPTLAQLKLIEDWIACGAPKN